MSRNSWFTCPCITVISSTQSELSKLKENLIINSSKLFWTNYLQMASSVLFKFPCTSSELFSITLITFSSQIMYLGRRKSPMSWSKVHIIRKLIKLAAHQILVLPLLRSDGWKLNWDSCSTSMLSIVTFFESMKSLKSTIKAWGSLRSVSRLRSGTEKRKG